jgi:hypothetical protein
MILPTGATVAVADGETVRLFHNAGVKPEVHLVEITAAPPAPAADDPISTHNHMDVVPNLQDIIDSVFNIPPSRTPAR